MVSAQAQKQKKTMKKWFVISLFMFSSLTLILDYGISYAETNISLRTNLDFKINHAFEAILNAEHKGANITELTEKINIVNDLYKEVLYALREGNSETAITLAQECETLSIQVADEANTLGQLFAEQMRIGEGKRNITRRVSIIVVIIISYVLWSKRRQFFITRTLRLKPMVTCDES